MLNRYAYFRTKGFRSIFSDEPQPTLYFLDALLHNPHDTSTPQYIIPTIHHPTIHHPHHTSSSPYITSTIHHRHNTSSPPYITPTIHHPRHTSSSPYIIPTIHHLHHTSSPPYIIPTIHHPTIHHLHHTSPHHTSSPPYILTPYIFLIIHDPHHTPPPPYITPTIYSPCLVMHQSLAIPYLSPQCPPTFTMKHDLGYHVNTHNEKVMCETCSATYYTRTGLCLHKMKICC